MDSALFQPRKNRPTAGANEGWATGPRSIAKPGRSKVTIREHPEGTFEVLGAMQPDGRGVYWDGTWLVIDVPAGDGCIRQHWRIDKALGGGMLSGSYLFEYPRGS
ncbi:MAG: hypothetical protein ACSLE9_07790 [Burkholderiaceae bacterium]